MKNAFRFLLTLLAVSMLNNSLTGQTVKPAIKVEKGQKFEYGASVEITSTQSMGGQDYSTVVYGTSFSDAVVENILESGEPVITSSNRDISIKTSIMGIDTVISMPGQVGPSMQATYNLNGGIIVKETIENSQASPAMQGFDNSGANSALFVEFPESGVTIGQTWKIEKTDTVSGNMNGEMQVVSKTSYTLKGTEIIDGTECYKVSFTGEIEITGNGNMQGMDIFIEGTGVNEGTTFVKVDNGVIYKTNTDTEMNLTLALTGAQSMTMPMQQRMKIEQKLKL
ncbi:MAG: hypothetical protein JXB34_05730 [Bacteroidales bacterium]|nr:hypothetical protein [Bacteroidales bacterium]